MIDIPPAWMIMVRDILKTYVPDRRVLAFGSRVTGVRLKPHSDLDLCIMGDTAVSSDVMGAMRDAFSESDLPIRVDLVDWASTKPTFQAIIQQHTDIVQDIPSSNMAAS